MHMEPVRGNAGSLLKLVEQRIKLKKELEEKKKKQHINEEPQSSLVSVPYLPQDCISNIILRLPLESLDTTRFVCKSWYGIVNCPIFIDAHLQRSDIGLIYFTPVRTGLPLSSTKKANFAVESKLPAVPIQHWPLIDPPPLFHLKFLEIKDGKSNIKDYHTTCMGKIRATCRGLIVLDNCLKKGGLIILNPVTREIEAVPLGTRCSPHQESYGLAFCQETCSYKLVHLFKDELRYVGCEIMNIGGGSWRAVDGPPFGLFRWFGYQPVFAMQALHWVPHADHNEYIISMSLCDEKFEKMKLPKDGGVYDRILELCGFLGFVSHVDANRIDVWILRSLSGEGWEKQYSISVDCMMNWIPLYFGRDLGEIVFKHKDNDLYAYDHRSRLMRKVEANKEQFSFRYYFPHVNSLISWRSSRKNHKNEV